MTHQLWIAARAVYLHLEAPTPEIVVFVRHVENISKIGLKKLRRLNWYPAHMLGMMDFIVFSVLSSFCLGCPIFQDFQMAAASAIPKTKV